MNEDYTRTNQSNFFNQKVPKDHISIRSIIYKKDLTSQDKKLPFLNDYKFPTLESSIHLISIN